MNEDDAQTWIKDRFGQTGWGVCAEIVERVRSENQRQNLVSAASLATIWSRHVVDSAQLVDLAPATGQWVDIGTGAGFPGLIVAALRHQPTVLVEPRPRRCDFLRAMSAALNLELIAVRCDKVERISGTASVISARAVASIADLFAMANHLADDTTAWLLPKGRTSGAEISAAKNGWTGVFHVERSLTAEDSAVIVARQVQRR